jgi:hypothetical protein
LYEGNSKSIGIFPKNAHLYKYKKTKLILLFKVIPFDFNAPVPAFRTFSNSVRIFFGGVASLTNFAPRQFLERIVTAVENLVHHYEPESKAQSMN